MLCFEKAGGLDVVAAGVSDDGSASIDLSQLSASAAYQLQASKAAVGVAASALQLSEPIHATDGPVSGLDNVLLCDDLPNVSVDVQVSVRSYLFIWMPIISRITAPSCGSASRTDFLIFPQERDS
jgi:hypothetical protein